MPGIIISVQANTAQADAKIIATGQVAKSVAAQVNGATAAGAAATANMASNVEKAAHGIPGLNLVLRETLVIFREIGRGNWARVPGSFSLVIQGLAQMRSQLGWFGAIFTVTGAVVTGTLAAIVASFFIFRHRVNSLADELADSVKRIFNADHIPKYLQKINEVAEAEKNINDEVWKRLDAYNSVSEAADRELAIAKKKIDYERELLRAKRENEIAGAKTKDEKRAIEDKYAALGLALNKKERDAELAAMQKEKTDLENEVKQKLAEMQKVAPKTSEARHKQDLKNAEEAAKAAEEYQKQFDPESKEKDTREHSLDQDRVLQNAVTAYESKMAWFREKFQDWITDPVYVSGLEKARAIAAAAKSRLEKNQSAITGYNSLLDAENDDKRARERADALQKDADNAAANAALLDGPAGKIAQKIAENAAADAHEAQMEALRKAAPSPEAEDAAKKERNNAGRAPVSDRERIGAYRAGSGDLVLSVAKDQHKELIKHTVALDKIDDTLKDIENILYEGGY